MKRILILSILLLGSVLSLSSQAYERYVAESDPPVLQKLDAWQDWKFGLMMHWGAYSIWGIVESWSLCSEPEWTRHGPYAHDYVEYKRQYELLPQQFNPVKFDPDKWAKAAKAAGMKYVVFTTKHHDGFCMFDSRYTDYKITDSKVPFHTHPKANVAKEIFASFRKEGFGIGAYFSKPDWHHPDYWASEWATPDRNVNYNTRKYPERWQRFADFTYNQIEELMTSCGSIDILWLDGGWVRPFPSEEAEREAAKHRLWNQDINMERIARMARNNQPGLLVVDRTVGGPYENYLTPEQSIPDRPLSYPWETCMTMASSWSYTPGDRYKPTRRIIHMLADIVSKGGNYLLNIGPGPDGDFDTTAYRRLTEIGQWMDINSEAIYGTRPIAPYKQENVCYTAKDNCLYGIYLAGENEVLPEKVTLKGITVPETAIVTLLGIKNKCRWRPAEDGIVIEIPAAARKIPLPPYAWTFKIKK
jgi:alpha-L-fucosidase